MSKFPLPDFSPPCQVELIDSLTQDQLLSFPAFRSWTSTLKRSIARQHAVSHAFHTDPYTLRGIQIQAVDYFGGGSRIGFLKLTADVRNSSDDTLPASMLLRGPSVAMLLLLQPDDIPPTSGEKYAIMTLQARIPAGSLSFPELPAGMLDDNSSVSGAAAKEIEEETGLKLHRDDLVDLTSLALDASPRDSVADEDLYEAMYPSPGGCDESISIFLYEKRIPRAHLGHWQGKLTGLRAEGEKITLKIVPFADLWRHGARDAKTLAACALYEGLRRDGRI